MARMFTTKQAAGGNAVQRAEVSTLPESGQIPRVAPDGKTYIDAAKVAGKTAEELLDDVFMDVLVLG